MSFYHLDANGYFYANGSIVKVSKKPIGVKRYIIYNDIEKPTIIPVKSKLFDMKSAKLLEVVTERLERIFFAYEDGGFVQKFFKPIDIMEGEHELLKHLGLLGLECAKHYDELWTKWVTFLKKHGRWKMPCFFNFLTLLLLF